MVVENHSIGDCNDCESLTLEYSISGGAEFGNKEISSSVAVVENGKIAKKQ